MRFICLEALLCILFGTSFPVTFAASVPVPVHGLWIWKSPTILGAPRGADALRDFCADASFVGTATHFDDV